MRTLKSILLLIFAIKIICEDLNKKIFDHFMDKHPRELFALSHLVFKKDYHLNSEI